MRYWGDSWGSSWGDSWGAAPAEVTGLTYVDHFTKFTDSEGNVLSFGFAKFGPDGGDPSTTVQNPFGDLSLSVPALSTIPLNADGSLKYPFYLSGPQSVSVYDQDGTAILSSSSMSQSAPISIPAGLVWRDDSTGEPLVGGVIHFGETFREPTKNPKNVYSDSGFSSSLGSSITLNSGGATGSTIHLSGEYSVKLVDADNVQVGYTPKYLAIEASQASGPYVTNYGLTGFGQYVGIFNAVNAVYVLPDVSPSILLADATDDTGEKVNYGLDLEAFGDSGENNGEILGVYVPETDEAWCFKDPGPPPLNQNTIIIQEAAQTAAEVSITDQMTPNSVCYVSGGKIYGKTRFALGGIIYDAVTRAATQIDLGMGAGSDRYSMTQASNGYIYCVKSSSGSSDPDVIVIDPSDNSYVASNMGLSGASSAQFGSLSFGRPAEISGKLIYPPYDSSTMMIIDTATDTRTFPSFGLTLGNNAFQSIGFVAGDDGLLYAAPDYDDVALFLIYNHSDGSAEFSDAGFDAADLVGMECNAGVKASNGKIHFWNRTTSQMMIIPT